MRAGGATHRLLRWHMLMPADTNCWLGYQAPHEGPTGGLT